jgi:hypothetical protein
MARTLSIWSTRKKPAPVFGGPKQVLQQSSCKRCQRLVRAEGLEPPQLSSLEPKSSASTSSATPADSIMSGMSGRDAQASLPKNVKRFSGGQSCSKLMESITFMGIQMINVIAAAGL